MAIVFSLEFGCFSEKSDYKKVIELVDKNFSKVQVSPDLSIDFHPCSASFITEKGPDYGQVSVDPKRVSIASSLDHPHREHDVNDDQMLLLAQKMYEFLKPVHSFDVALLGWEIGSLYHNYQRLLDTKAPPEMEGFVFRKDLCDSEVAFGMGYEVFSKDYLWLPIEDMPGNLF